MSNQPELERQVRTVIEELLAAYPMGSRQILVIGTSTSEVMGERIGTSGSEQAAETIFRVLKEYQSKFSFHLAFQCCEHLNRALVVEQETADLFRLDEVTVVPVPKAGGSMAAHAFQQLAHPAVVESIQAHAGIDIGDTFIGMHLRSVAVPLRPSIRQIGNAHVTMAYTRPKLIGGTRAVYPEKPQNLSCT
ncbi:TIGR01440 family protein [Ammoniphilus sp. CFH 90114]|uniref:TIGR01440 family protein n=1 Tax=Ammoniphilus sp. CFH 90114 TaxID=2493665 RepID=UPI00100FF963|nr:TIGR01440 family protein [Ammoniphilus sp. CFH 90114]RXT08683.1 TIGR01440 family protein [Ammoniphilus sp. CFH 90114]